MKPILAVLVLYNMPLGESPTYVSLMRALEERPELGEGLRLLVCDNSAEAQTLPAGFAGRYLQDGANPGLAGRYNLALREAAGVADWLLLLDQDTRVTAAYFEELLALAGQVMAEVAAIVPKLVSEGRMLSPHPPSYRAGSQHVHDRASYGMVPELLRAFNSGALVRVSAMNAIGGFPEEYWLDYLDHAVFHRLQAAGGRVFVMRAELEHEMTHLQPGRRNGRAAARRHSDQLAAELRFYREHGTADEQRRHRRDLARKAFYTAREGDFAQAARLLKAALSPAPAGKARR